MALRLSKFSKRSEAKQLDLFGDEAPAKTFSKTVAQTPDKPASAERSRSTSSRRVAQSIAQPGAKPWEAQSELERARTVFGTSRGDDWAMHMYTVRQAMFASLHEPLRDIRREPAKPVPARVCEPAPILRTDCKTPKCVLCGKAPPTIHSAVYGGSVHRDCWELAMNGGQA